MADARGTDPRAPWTVGVDVGGTFADAVAVSDGGDVRRLKLLTDGRLRTACGPAPDGANPARRMLTGIPAWAAPALAGAVARGPGEAARRVTAAGPAGDE